MKAVIVLALALGVASIQLEMVHHDDDVTIDRAVKKLIKSGPRVLFNELNMITSDLQMPTEKREMLEELLSKLEARLRQELNKKAAEKTLDEKVKKLQTSIKKVAALVKKYTNELTESKTKIQQLLSSIESFKSKPAQKVQPMKPNSADLDAMNAEKDFIISVESMAKSILGASVQVAPPIAPVKVAAAVTDVEEDLDVFLKGIDKELETLGKDVEAKIVAMLEDLEKRLAKYGLLKDGQDKAATEHKETLVQLEKELAKWQALQHRCEQTLAKLVPKLRRLEGEEKGLHDASRDGYRVDDATIKKELEQVGAIKKKLAESADGEEGSRRKAGDVVSAKDKTISQGGDKVVPNV